MARQRKLVSHDNVQLTPMTAFDGPTLEFNFPDMKVGIAEYEEGPTGCTVFHFPKGVSTAVDIRGGSVGAIETGYGWYHAICFAGGSLYGLEAALGVRAELLALQNYSINWENIPLVSGAIIWDWGGRNNAIYPDINLGRAALHQLAKQVHSSMAQAIQPFHTQYDGDILYAITTNEVKTKTLDELDIGFIASELAWDAVLNSYRDS